MRKRSAQTLPEWLRDREHPQRSRRVNVRVPVKIDDGRRLVSGTIVDLSRDGFRIQVEEPVAPNQSVMLIRGQDAAPADVKWVDGLEIGAVLKDSTQRRKW